MDPLNFNAKIGMPSTLHSFIEDHELHSLLIKYYQMSLLLLFVAKSMILENG